MDDLTPAKARDMGYSDAIANLTWSEAEARLMAAPLAFGVDRGEVVQAWLTGFASGLTEGLAA